MKKKAWAPPLSKQRAGGLAHPFIWFSRARFALSTDCSRARSSGSIRIQRSRTHSRQIIFGEFARFLRMKALVRKSYLVLSIRLQSDSGTPAGTLSLMGRTRLTPIFEKRSWTGGPGILI